MLSCRAHPSKPSEPPPAPPSRLETGFNIVEVIVGMAIFSFMVIGLLSLTFQVRASSEEAVYNNTSLTLAQAYLEQMRSSDFATLQAAALDTSGSVGLDLISSAGTILTDTSGGVLANGDWASEIIMLDEDDAGNPRQPLTFRFRPLLVDLNSVTSGQADGIEIILYYQTTYNFGSVRTQNGSLRTVRSNVSTF
jgi:type II secretory pathway pseudopilin PulG